MNQKPSFFFFFPFSGVFFLENNEKPKDHILFSKKVTKKGLLASKLVFCLQSWPDGQRVDAWSQLEVVVREANMQADTGKTMESFLGHFWRWMVGKFFFFFFFKGKLYELQERSVRFFGPKTCAATRRAGHFE